jgi:hypothetical protein
MPCVLKLEVVGLPHITIQLPVPHLTNTSTQLALSRFSLNQLNFPTKIQLKDFIPLLKINPFYTNRSAWHAKVDWNASRT